MSEAKRADRVSERLRQELAWLVAREVRDPRVAKVVVARVEMPDDLRSARVFVRLLEGGDDPARRKEALAGLSRAAGMLRRLSSGRMGLRYAPELKFVYDEAQEKVDRIEQLLEEVKREQGGR
jgi:ribosome-binding factor A